VIKIEKSQAERSSAVARERLRKRYRPDRVQILFIGEAPPASGRFFYKADSGLYRAIRRTFLNVFPDLENTDFLVAFRDLGCYLVDLCGTPVDRLPTRQRLQVCNEGEVRLASTIMDLRPKVIVTIVRSIVENVRRAKESAGWEGTYLELPYPGRWQSHRIEFSKALKPLLRRELRAKEVTRHSDLKC
jgi:hypothetical protein